MAMVDPNFHASPPSEGTVLYRSTQGRKLTIDPALYSPGPHALVLRSCTHDTLASPGKAAHRCGVLKLPFTTPSPPPARTSS